jgi:cell division inhibitor SepF
MATAMKRLGVYLGLVEDEPGYDGYDQSGNPVNTTDAHASHGGGQGYESRRSSTLTSAPSLTTAEVQPVDVRTAPRSSASVAAAVSEPMSGSGVDPYSIHTIHPRSYNEARRIGEEFRAGSPVIMNLSEMDDTDAKRIVDFAAGLVFALRGSMERVTKKVFLLSPANVDVRDAPAVQQARDGFFNQS